MPRNWDPFNVSLYRGEQPNAGEFPYGNMSKKRVFMVEDEALLRDLFAQYVELLPDVEYLGSSGDGKEAIEKALTLKPDILILDLRLPEVNGLEILVLLSRKLPDTRILIFTGSTSQQSIEMAVRCGAAGFVEKSFGLDALKKAIEAVARGETYYTENAARLIRTVQAN